MYIMYSKLKHDLLIGKIPQDIIFDEIFNKFNFNYFRIIDDYKFNFYIGEFLFQKNFLIESLYFFYKSILNNENDLVFLEKCKFYLSKIKINKFNFIIKNTNNLLLLVETLQNIIPFSNKIFILNTKNKIDIKYKNLFFKNINSKEDFFKFVFDIEKPLLIIESGYTINQNTIKKITLDNKYKYDNYSFLINYTNFDNSYFYIKPREIILINNNQKKYKLDNLYIEKLNTKIDIILDLSSELINERFNNVEQIIKETLSKIPKGYNSFSFYHFLYNCINYFLYKQNLLKAKEFIIEALDIYNNDDILYELLFYISIKENNFIFSKEISNNYLKINPRNIKFTDLLFFAKNHLKYENFEQDKNLKEGLSVCIIVKNEEKYIGECIDSVKEIANEVIVLDTGSTDNTVNIAKSKGAKVYFYVWDNNFSNAKNKVMDYASYQWIFILDSDEILLNPSNVKGSLLSLLSDKNILAIDVLRIEKVNNSKMRLTRIFRKYKEIYFEGSIHEQVNHLLNKASEKYNMRFSNSNIEILHYGYLPEVMERKKTNERNLLILEKAINRNIENPRIILYYKIKYLCNLIDLERNNKTLDISIMKKIENLTKEIYYDYTNFKTVKDIDLFIPTIQYVETVFARMMKFNKNYEALEFNSFFVKYFPYTVIINYNQSLALYKNYKFFEALLYAKKAFYLHITDISDKSSIYNEEVGNKHCPYIIGLIYEVLEFYELSSFWFELILNKFPNFENAIEHKYMKLIFLKSYL